MLEAKLFKIENDPNSPLKVLEELNNFIKDKRVQFVSVSDKFVLVVYSISEDDKINLNEVYIPDQKDIDVLDKLNYGVKLNKLDCASSYSDDLNGMINKINSKVSDINALMDYIDITDESSDKTSNNVVNTLHDLINEYNDLNELLSKLISKFFK